MRRAGFRKHGLFSMGGLLNKSLDQLGMRHKILERQAITRWAEIVGPHIAASSAAENVREGVMFVACKSSMWANELTLLKQDILGKYENAFGRKKIITDIRFSARGFKRALERAANEETEDEPVYLELAPASEQDVRKADEIASAAEDSELAERIRKAVITGRRRAEMRRREEK